MIAIELTKQVRRARGWATMASMTAVSLLLVVVIGTTRASVPERIGDWGSVVTNASGFVLPLIVLNVMTLFLLPLAAAIFAGESVAGEAAWGSLRYVLSRPVARWRVLATKAAAAAAFSVATVVVVVLVSLLASGLAFGWGSLTVIDLQHTTALHLAAASFAPLDAVGRLAMATGFVVGTLASTFTFAFLLSALTDRPFSAVAGGVGLCLVSRSLDNISGFHALSPWLPATDAGTTAWTGFFTSPPQFGGVGHELLVQLVYSTIFLSAACIWFTRSDVLS